MSDAKPAAKVSPKNAAAGCGCLVVVVLVLAAMLGMCTNGGEKAADSAPAVKAPPRSLQSADKAIVSADVSGSAANLKVKLSTAWDDAQYVDFAGLTVKNVGEKLQAGVDGAEGLEVVNLMFTAPGTDRLGKELELDFMTISFSAADLKAANFDNLGIARTLNLATDVSWGSRSGGMALAQWCLKDDNAQDAAAFCAKVAD